MSDLPRWDVTALTHEGPEGEPQAVEYAELVGRLVGLDLPVLVLLGVPLVRAEAADEEQHHADADVGEHDAHPDLVGERIQEGEDSRFGLLRLLDHDGDSQGHEGLGEVDHLLSHQSDGERSHGNICFLSDQRRKNKQNRMKTRYLDSHLLQEL